MRAKRADVTFLDIYRDRALSEPNVHLALSNRDSSPTALMSSIADRMEISDGQSVVDIGCGSGEFSRIAEQRAKLRKNVGVLPTDEEAARLREHLKNTSVEVVHGNVYHTGLPSHSFDRVLCNSVLILVGYPERGLKEIARLAAPGGLIYIGEIPFQPEYSANKRARPAAWRWIASTFKHKGLVAGVDASFYALNMALAGNWKDIGPRSTFYISEPEFGTLAIKYGLRVLRVYPYSRMRVSYLLTPL